jgi:general secretion pathway protein M
LTGLGLSLPVRRLLAVGLLLVAIMLVWTMLVAPLAELYEAERADTERMALAVEKSPVRDEDLARLRRDVQLLKERQDAAAGLLQAASEAIAGAQLQNRLKEVVGAAQGELRSTQTLPSRDDGNFRRITVRGQLSLSLAALQQVLYTLEAASPYLFLDNVAVQARADERDKDRAESDGLLDVRFDLSGYMRRPS